MIHTFFGYKLKKNKMHNAMHDCLNVLKVLKKTKFILQAAENQKVLA